jgi:hypothetical protein
LQPCGYSPSPRAARDIAVYQRHGADYDAIADRDTFLGHALRPNIDARADANRRKVDGSNASAETARDGVVRVNLSAGADIAMVPDCQPTLPVKDHVGADPAVLSHFDVAQDQHIVVTGSAFAKSIVSGNFPSIGQQIADRNVATKSFSHLATKIENEMPDRLTNLHRSPVQSAA